MLKSNLPSIFKKRRDALMTKHPGAAFVLPATPEYIRNMDINFEYRQDSNFYYLTGFDEPESVLVLSPDLSQPGRTYQTVLFVMKRDPEREIWEGERYGVEGAKAIFGADLSYPIDELESRLPELLKPAQSTFFRLGRHEPLDRTVIAALKSTQRMKGRTGEGLTPVLDPNQAIGELRLFKSEEEVKMMRQACKITANAHKQAMIETKPGMHEFEIAALMEYQFKKNGCERLAYPSIVAGGKNATCLHYTRNNEVLRDGDLLLIDAGGELDYLASDITRTFPVGKTFSKQQKEVYSLVLKAQKEAVAMITPGIRFMDVHDKATSVLVEGLLTLGLLKGERTEIIKMAKQKRFYPHGTGHWLGTDTHDVGLYLVDGKSRILEPGMVFTVEPGLYIQPGDLEAPEVYRNIGVRIEDDILVTTNGHENLTRDAPKEIEEIESLRKG